MKLGIYVEHCQQARGELKSVNPVLTNVEWRAGKKKEQLDISKLSQEERDYIKAIVDREAKAGDSHYKTVKRKWDEWATLLNQKTGPGAVVEKLDLVPAAFKAYFKDLDHKWVFLQADDGTMLPYFIEELEYHRAYMSRGNYTPAQVSMSIVAYKRGEKTYKNYTYLAKHINRTVPQMLSIFGLTPETKEAVDKFKETFKRYQELQAEVGKQMHAYGEGYFENSSSWWSSRDSSMSMVRDGVPTKVVLDDDNADEDEDDSWGRSSSSSNSYILDDFWGEVPNRSGMSDKSNAEIAELFSEMGEANRVDLPIHPYIRVFDLDKHRWGTINTENLQEYPWDETLMDKLVIKEDDKELIGLLMNRTGQAVEDIVKGKMAGVVVLATGVPGIGKTLTAEVFSEVIRKPLYTVQCSQLGLNVDEIEKNLKGILSRAGRWGAILLIDEADVYIRKRGEDIVQNAIVGVFLRLIEYYRGVLFMTSNRGEEIDDAIISRATAWVRYELPEPEQLKRIFQVLGEQYKAKFKDGDLNRLVNNFQGISGRTARNLLKLAHMLKGEGFGAADVMDVARYQARENDRVAQGVLAKGVK